MNTQLISSSRPSSSLCGNKIRVYGLDMSHRQFSITPKYKYQDKWVLIQSTQKKLTIKCNNIEAKIQNKLLWIKPNDENPLKKLPLKKIFQLLDY